MGWCLCFPFTDLLCSNYDTHHSPTFGAITERLMFASCLLHTLWLSNTYVGASSLCMMVHRHTWHAHCLTSPVTMLTITMPALYNTSGLHFKKLHVNRRRRSYAANIWARRVGHSEVYILPRCRRCNAVSVPYDE
jgi:hypothetical protein